MDKGEFVAVMGPSGSGKSTLLNCISCYTPYESGLITLSGEKLSGLSEEALAKVRNEKLGFVFQDFMLLDGLTVRENILLPRIIHGEVSSDGKKNADRLLKLFGIDSIRDKYPAEISGGEKQRAAVARALINNPLLIFADEPTGNLDSRSSRAVIDSFLEARHSLDATIFMVTHDSFSASFCDRVIILKDGTVYRTLENRGSRPEFQDQLLDTIKDILDVVNEQRKSEPIRDVRSWYLPAGIFLIVFGAAAGYGHPRFFRIVFGVFAPPWANLLYLPILPGIYLLILFLVIRGRRSRRHPYRNIISRSMMKFQGRQTVNNMLIMTLLTAGACFAMFYVPVMASSSLLSASAWEKDFSIRLRADQDMPDREEISQLAEEYRLTVGNWAEAPMIVLGKDGIGEDIDENGKYVYQYHEVISDCIAISASGYEALTGEHLDLSPGTYDECINQDSAYGPDTETTLITNMVTGAALDVTYGTVHYSHTLSGFTVLNDEDFARISEGLDDSWKETFVQFDTDSPYGVDDEYRFSQALWERIVSASAGAGMDSSFYSRAAKTYCDGQGETYWADSDPTSRFSQEDKDTFQFWSLWKYKPFFRVMEQNNLFMNMAILFLTFLFMAVVCYTAALIISYTRSLTVALSNRQVYEDLIRLGAGNEFRFRSVRQQLAKIYSVPTILGMTAIALFFLMILFANDGRISLSEGVGMGVCLVIMLILGAIIFLFYQRTLKVVCRMLGIRTG